MADRAPARFDHTRCPTNICCMDPERAARQQPCLNPTGTGAIMRTAQALDSFCVANHMVYHREGTKCARRPPTDVVQGQ